MIKKIYNRTKKRRGITPALGALLAIVIMAGTVNVTIWIIRQQDTIGQQVIEKQNMALDRLEEDIRVDDIRITNSKLNLAIANDGSSRAVLKSLYVVNETSQQQYRYDLDVVVDGRETVTNIGQSTPAVILRDDAAYTVKVVSESGNSVAARIRPVSEIAFPITATEIRTPITPPMN